MGRAVEEALSEEVSAGQAFIRSVVERESGGGADCGEGTGEGEGAETPDLRRQQGSALLLQEMPTNPLGAHDHVTHDGTKNRKNSAVKL